MDDSDDRSHLPWWSRAAGKVLIAAIAVAVVSAVAIAKFSGQVQSALSTPARAVQADGLAEANRPAAPASAHW